MILSDDSRVDGCSFCILMLEQMQAISATKKMQAPLKKAHDVGANARNRSGKLKQPLNANTELKQPRNCSKLAARLFAPLTETAASSALISSWLSLSELSTLNDDVVDSAP